jgi:hypothetical protein
MVIYRIKITSWTGSGGVFSQKDPKPGYSEKDPKPSQPSRNPSGVWGSSRYNPYIVRQHNDDTARSSELGKSSKPGGSKVEL